MHICTKKKCDVFPCSHAVLHVLHPNPVVSGKVKTQIFYSKNHLIIPEFCAEKKIVESK